MAKKLDEFLDSTIEDPKEYNEELAREEGSGIEEGLKASGKIEVAPADGLENEERASRARVVARNVVDFTQDDEIPVPIVPVDQELILVADFDGRIRAWSYNNIQVVQGFAQSLKGRKRLFRKVDGRNELQEINALGDPIDR